MIIYLLIIAAETARNKYFNLANSMTNQVWDNVNRFKMGDGTQTVGANGMIIPKGTNSLYY